MDTTLSSSLDQTLEDLSEILQEDAFFKGLGDFIFSRIEADRLLIYKVLKDSSLRPVAKYGKYTKENFKKNNYSLDYVLKNQRPYLNNSSEGRFFFEGEKDQPGAELCFPILYKEVLLGIISLQAFSHSSFSYSSEDVDLLNGILSRLDAPCEILKESLEKNAFKRKREGKKSIIQKKTVEIYALQGEKEIVVHGEKMKVLMEFADKMGSMDISLLIQGEEGTGKEMIARRIHYKSKRKDYPFIVVDCSLFDISSLKEELFGGDLKSGLFEKADKGTLLLKNIFEMPFSVQEKLLSFLREKPVSGQPPSDDPLPFDVRIIGTFREKTEEKTNLKKELMLYLDMFNLKIPPLRERREDVSVFVDYFFKKFFPEQEIKFFQGILRILERYSWPGNIGELEKIVRGVSMDADGVLKKKDLPRILFEDKKKKESSRGRFVEKSLKNLEKKHIFSTLEYFQGNKTKAAKSLGITIKTLYNKLHSFDLMENCSFKITERVEKKDV